MFSLYDIGKKLHFLVKKVKINIYHLRGSATHCATLVYMLSLHYFLRHILFIYHIRDFRHIGDCLGVSPALFSVVYWLVRGRAMRFIFCLSYARNLRYKLSLISRLLSKGCRCYPSRGVVFNEEVSRFYGGLSVE